MFARFALVKKEAQDNINADNICIDFNCTRHYAYESALNTSKVMAEKNAQKATEYESYIPRVSSITS
jgi:hypothetical protein